MDKGREQLNKLLTDQYRQYRRRMHYIENRLRWPWGPWYLGGTKR